MAKRQSSAKSEACAPKRAGKQGARSSGGKSAKADKQAEDASVLAVEQWERTFDAVPDLVAILDTQYRIVRANKAMAERLGLAKDQCSASARAVTAWWRAQTNLRPPALTHDYSRTVKNMRSSVT